MPFGWKLLKWYTFLGVCDRLCDCMLVPLCINKLSNKIKQISCSVLSQLIQIHEWMNKVALKSLCHKMFASNWKFTFEGPCQLCQCDHTCWSISTVLCSCVYSIINFKKWIVPLKAIHVSWYMINANTVHDA